VLNSLLPQTQHIDAEAFRALLSGYVERWKSATTNEGRLAIEADAIRKVGDILNGNLSLPRVEAGDHPLTEDWLVVANTQDTWIKSTLGRVVKLAELYLRYYNEQKINELQTLGLIRRIRQKQAAVRLWNDEGTGYCVAEHFLNLEDIRTGSLVVDTNQGVVTLPVRKVVEIPIASLAVGPGSNGFLGNSDVAVTQNTKQLANALDAQGTTWFEYERLDNGPVRLNLLVKLDRPQVLNHLSIKTVGQGFVVEDCKLNNTLGKAISLKTLTDDWNGTITKIGQDTSWSCSFLPTQTAEFTLQLVGTEHHPVRLAVQGGRTILRPRYAIAIQEILVQRIEYAGEGVLESQKLSIPTQMLVGEGQAVSFPPTNLFHTVVAEYSQNGKDWQSFDQTLVLDGDGTLQWRLKVLRDDDAFKKQTSFAPQLLSEEVESSLRTVSRYQSPARLSLGGKVPVGVPVCFQPKLLRRGEAHEAIELGVGTGAQVSFRLPLKVTEYGVDSNHIRIFVSNIEWTYVESENDLGFGFWTLSDDLESVLFDGALPSGARVKIVLDPEYLVLSEGYDGY
jgi:hypothetical protein